MSTPDFSSLGLQVPEIYLPRPDIDLAKWAVIACDQYTSEADYWQRVSAQVGDAPSTLNLIFPEIFLEDAERASRIEDIQQAMLRYASDGTLAAPKRMMVALDRATTEVPSRKGLVVAVDLDAYDYREGATSLVRATEATFENRLAPRIAIREGASIELPHIMVLIDDPDGRVIEPVIEAVRDQSPLYDIDLMLDGGHITGWAVQGDDLLERIHRGLTALADPDRFHERYDVAVDDVFLYAMGDGNHSLATAKSIWESMKRDMPNPRLIADHPARHALVELVNLHDPGLQFEPIHRVVFDVDPTALLAAFGSWAEQAGGAVEIIEQPDLQTAAVQAKRHRTQSPDHVVAFCYRGVAGMMVFKNVAYQLTVGVLQAFIDDYLASEATQGTVDYIHGESSTRKLADRERAIGFLLPGMDKHDLFKTVILEGALPCKTFSMGDANEKRFYVECRRIIP
jgi:hypothetical protein